LRGVDERMKQAAEGVGQRWIKALNDDGEILGADSGGGLDAKNLPKTTQNDISA